MNQTDIQDHTSKWKAPLHNDGWVLAHNAIRGELSDFMYVINHLTNRVITNQHCQNIRLWWKGHVEHIEGHHSNEDDLLNPFIRSRVDYPEKLEKDHEFLVGCIKDINVCLEETPISIAKLKALWVNYCEHMLPHLLEEEKVGIPLLRKHFTPKEFEIPMQKLMEKASPLEFGCFIYYNGGKTYIKKFMKQEGIPWFVWYLSFRGHLRKYKKEMIAPLKFLKYN